MSDPIIVQIAPPQILVQATSPQVLDINVSNVGSVGISAYDVAVINGFVGTEQEWLASLIGDYNLPIATDAILGGVKVGDNLTIDEYGKLNAQNVGDSMLEATIPILKAPNNGQILALEGMKVTKGVRGAFVDLMLGDKCWTSLASIGNDLYASIYGGSIWKSTNGGAFVDLVTGDNAWMALASIGNDLYACVCGGSIWKSTNGGAFVDLVTGDKDWMAIASIGNDLYACVYGGSIWKSSYTGQVELSKLKLTAGELNTVPEAGEIEFDGTSLYLVTSEGTNLVRKTIGETSLIKKTAMDLGGHRVVSCNSNGELIYADNLNDETINSVIGLTTSSSLSGSSTKILDYGEITFYGWSWVINSPIFLASNGLLTQTVPDNGWMIIMGFPTGVNSLFINIQETIKI